MKNKRFYFYVLLTSLGFVAAIAVGLFMYGQLRKMMTQYSDYTKKLNKDHIEYINTNTLATMTKYIETKYPVLYDIERLKSGAGSEWLWDIAEEWHQLADIFEFSYIYYVEKQDNGKYIFLLSSGVRRDEHPEWLGGPVWVTEPPSYVVSAWENQIISMSPEPTVNEWGVNISAARPFILNGKTIAVLGIDYDISFFNKLTQDELYLKEQETALLLRVRNILLVSVIIIVLFMGYQIWLSTRTTLISTREMEADERTKIMLDATPMLCSLWETDGTLIDCNKETLRVTGCSEGSEFIEHFFDMLPLCQADGENSREAIFRHNREALQKGNELYEWMSLTRNGEELPVDVTIVRVPWKNGYRLAVYSRDLREFIKKENRLRQVMATAEASPNVTFFLGVDGNIEYMNPAVPLLSGYSREELLSNGLQLLFDPADYNILFNEHISAALKGEAVDFEITLVSKSGEKLIINFSAFAVKMYDGKTGIGMTGRDITEKKRMQRDLAIAKEQAEKALASEVEYNQKKSDFLSRVSHELRTPLNAIIGMTNVNEKTVDEKERAKNKEKIKAASEHLLSLVNDILDLTSIDTDSFDFSTRAFSLSEALGSVIENITQKAKSKNLEFLPDIDKGIHDSLLSDERRLKQALLNLLNNAVKFTPENGKISFSASELSCDNKECTIRFVISDTGIGMSPEALAHLGGIFEQADSSITREYGGMGLGLPITKRIVEMMNGRISVESEPGKGTRFTCDVKLEIAGKETSAAADENPANLDLWGKNVLVVDDVEINREIIIAMLEGTGAVFDGAGDGAEAFEMFLKKKYDLVLIDLHMPVMDGYTSVRKMRASELPWAKTVPVISISAENSRDLREKCLAAGISDYLSKPLEMESLFKIIAKWMKP